MKKAQKKKNNHKKWFLYILFTGFVLRTLSFLFPKKNKKYVKKNFLSFLAREEKEVEKFIHGREAPDSFLKHTCLIARDYFMPGEHNNFKPRILRRKSLVVLAVLALLVKSSVLGYLYFIYPSEGLATDDIERGVIELVNRNREDAGLEPLEINDALSRSAAVKARDMLDRDYFAHESPDGRKPWDWISRDNYDYLYVGENLAMNFTSAESVHHALMQSPSHKRNIMNAHYDNIGVAVVSGNLNGKTTNLLVQFFGSRTTRHLAMEAEKDSTAGTTNESVAVPPKGDKEPAEAKQPDKPAQNKEDTDVAGIGNQAEAGQADSVQPEEVRRSVETKSKEPVAASARDNEETRPDLVSEFTSYSALKHEQATKDEFRSKLFAGQVLKSMESTESASGNAGGFAVLAQYLLLSILGLVVVSLALHILIRKEMRHKPVLIESMVFVLFVAGLVVVRMHFLEGGMPNILIM